jgi:hypothetical protein
MQVKPYGLLIAVALFLLAQLSSFAFLQQADSADRSIAGIRKEIKSGVSAHQRSVQRIHRASKDAHPNRCFLGWTPVAFRLAATTYNVQITNVLTSPHFVAPVKRWLLFCALLR